MNTYSDIKVFLDELHALDPDAVGYLIKHHTQELLLDSLRVVDLFAWDESEQGVEYWGDLYKRMTS